MHILKRVIPVFIIACLLTAYFLYERAKSTPNPNEITTSGYIEGHEVRLASLTGGRLASIEVSEGDSVAAGDIIAVFETDQLGFKLAEMQAALIAAESQYEKLINGPRPEELNAAYQGYLAAESAHARLAAGYREEDIAPLRSQLEGAEASLAKAESDYERMSNLYDEEIISRSEYEASGMAVDVARSKRDALLDQIAQMEKGFPDDEIEAAGHSAKSLYDQYMNLKEGARVEDIQAAEAELERLKAGIDGVKQQLSEAEVRTSTDGYIRDLPLRPGDIASAGMPVATLIEDGELWVRVYVPAYRLGLISLGQKGYIYPDAIPGESIEAAISYISPEGEFTPRNIQVQEDRIQQVFEIRLTVEGNNRRLKPGMGCEVVIPLNGRSI